jgi:putative ABC transport system substrate-binding protein
MRIDRRTFIAGAIALLAAPLTVEGQKPEKIARVGSLIFGPAPSPEEMAKVLKMLASSPFRLSMRGLGWVDGQNTVFEPRWGESADQRRASAAELGRLKVDVLVVQSGGVAAIAQGETRTIPIVVAGCGGDMVTAGFAASLARPGGNLTGLQILSGDLIGKRFQILKELVPSLARVATVGEIRVTGNREFAKGYAEAADDAARTLGIRVDAFGVSRPEDFPSVFRGMREKDDRGLLVYGSPFMWAHRTQIADLAATHRIAAIDEDRAYTKQGDSWLTVRTSPLCGLAPPTSIRF